MGFLFLQDFSLKEVILNSLLVSLRCNAFICVMFAFIRNNLHCSIILHGCLDFLFFKPMTLPNNQSCVLSRKCHGRTSKSGCDSLHLLRLLLAILLTTIFLNARFNFLEKFSLLSTILNFDFLYTELLSSL
jgi:hypothetical protein